MKPYPISNMVPFISILDKLVFKLVCSLVASISARVKVVRRSIKDPWSSYGIERDRGRERQNGKSNKFLYAHNCKQARGKERSLEPQMK